MTGIQIGRAEQGYTGPMRSAADQREARVWTEIPSGRQWAGTIEKKSGDFCGLPPQPYGWSAPFPEWTPPPHFLRCGAQWTIQRPGDTAPSRLRPDEMLVDYEGWVKSLEESHRSWMEQFYAFGDKMCGPAFDPENPPPQLLAAVGPKPMAIEPVYAMRQGNRYALGLTTVVDERLRPFFPKRWAPPEPDFSDTGAAFAESEDLAAVAAAPRRAGRPRRQREE